MQEKDWVHIVAVDTHGRILLTQQYRYAGNTFCSELPCGVAEENEEPLNAAKRELKEETGFEADEWTPIAVLYANPARQTNRIHCFLARDLQQVSAQKLDPAEDILFRFAAPDEIKKLIATGDFRQALHVSSFMLALETMRTQ